MFERLLAPLLETVRPHFGLSKTRLETLAVLLVGLANCRTVNLSHLASQFPIASGGGLSACSLTQRHVGSILKTPTLPTPTSLRPCSCSSPSPSHGPIAAQPALWEGVPFGENDMEDAKSPGSEQVSTPCETGSSITQATRSRHGQINVREGPYRLQNKGSRVPCWMGHRPCMCSSGNHFHSCHRPHLDDIPRRIPFGVIAGLMDKIRSTNKGSGARLPKSQARRARTWSERERMPYQFPPRVLLRCPSKGGFGECGNTAIRRAERQQRADSGAQHRAHHTSSRHLFAVVCNQLDRRGLRVGVRSSVAARRIMSTTCLSSRLKPRFGHAPFTPSTACANPSAHA